MDVDSGSLKMESKELLREVQKLEVRLDEYLKNEQEFVRHLRNCISQFNLLCTSVEKISAIIIAEKTETTELKTKAIMALSEAMQKAGKAEHERSHLLESYGALILALERIESSMHGAATPK
jgi:hypothetical protein